VPEVRLISMVSPDVDGLAALARSLAAEADLEGVLSSVLTASLTHIEGAEYAGITAFSRHGASTPVATDELVLVIDQLQYATGEGPCLSAAADHEAAVLVDDLTADARWPVFSDGAVSHGIASMLSLHLYTARDTIGALNVYAHRPHAFTADSVHTGVLLAAHSAAAIAAATTTRDLRRALDSRDVIGQAKGILMERFKITSADAFDMLITASQDFNRKLRDVAAEVTETGVLVRDK
jgi:transcriptional regulator with GAF, ATPase, and Fis domain